MTVKKFLENTKRFELEAYEKFPNLLLDHVPFTGTPRKHPYNNKRLILTADPLSTNPLHYEFNIEDIEGVEELPSQVTLDGQSVSMLRLWVRKGSIGIRSIPFVVEDVGKETGI